MPGESYFFFFFNKTDVSYCGFCITSDSIKSSQILYKSSFIFKPNLIQMHENKCFFLAFSTY